MILLNQDNQEKIKEYLKDFEIQEQLFFNYIVSLPNHLYAKMFLQIRTFIMDLPVSALMYKWRIPRHIRDFNIINFMNAGFKNSGLFFTLLQEYSIFCESIDKNKFKNDILSNIIYLKNCLNKDPQMSKFVLSGLKIVLKNPTTYFFYNEFEKQVVANITM